MGFRYDRNLGDLFRADPFWFIISVLILLQIGSCSVKNIYCEWGTCVPQEPALFLKNGDGE